MGGAAHTVASRRMVAPPWHPCLRLERQSEHPCAIAEDCYSGFVCFEGFCKMA